MLNPILNKKVKDLTWEDKRELVAAKYTFWVMNDSRLGDYSFLYDLITGQGVAQLTEENKALSESEFNETFFGDYQGAVEDTDDFEELTVKELLQVCGTSDEIIGYL